MQNSVHGTKSLTFFFFKHSEHHNFMGVWSTWTDPLIIKTGESLPFKLLQNSSLQYLQLYGNAEIFLAFSSNAVAHGNISVEFNKINLKFANISQHK